MENKNLNPLGLMDYFNNIKYADIYPALALTDLISGEVTLDRTHWPQLSEPWQRFILLHEAAHLVNRNTDEDSANAWAIDHFIDYTSPESFASTTGQLSHILAVMNAASPEEKARARQIMAESELKNPTRAHWITAVISAISITASELLKYDKKQKAGAEALAKQYELAQAQAAAIKQEQAAAAAAQQKNKFLPLLAVAVVLILIIIIY